MKIVFFGTPEYVLPLLNDLHQRFKGKSHTSPVVAIVTQKPKPVGRKKQLQFSPVDTWGHKRKIPVFFNPEDIITSKIEADIGILASYGKIISKEIIDHFPHGILNIHPSLLPKWRGASPIQAAIIEGKKQTGVSIIKLDEKLDHGPIISQFKENILDSDTSSTLRQRLFKRGSKVLIELLNSYMKGDIKPRMQDEDQATYTKQLSKKDGFIPPKILNSALQGSLTSGNWKKWKIGFIDNYTITPSVNFVERFIRAMQPWPISWTTVKIKGKKLRIKVLESHIEETPLKLVLDKVQLEGKKPVAWKQFREGYPKVIFE